MKSTQIKEPASPLSGTGKEFAASKNLRRWAWGAALVIAVILAYQPAWHAGYIWDDDIYVTDNPLLSAPDGLRRIWFSFESPSQYFPLVYTTFRIEKAIWGLDSTGYHWVNILLHAANALLVWWLLARLKIPGAWLAAAIFALHPVQVESVAWITERKNVLSVFFVLLTLLAWTQFIADDAPKKWRYYALALACCMLALFAKTTACTLPAAMLLILWLQRKPIGRRRIFEIAPFLALGVAMGLLTMWWERYHQGTQGKLFALGLADRVLIASHAVWFYLGKLLWPTKLTFSYPRWTLDPWNPLAYGWLIAAVAAGWAIHRWRGKTGRGVEAAALYFVATLSPLLGFIMLFTFRFTFVADHYQYAACIGPIALLSAGIVTLAGRRPQIREEIYAATGMIVLALGFLTWRQCHIYRDNESLWQDTMEKSPDSFMAYSNLGFTCQLRGQLNDAIGYYEKTLELNPDMVETRLNLGIAYRDTGRMDKALAQFQKALEIDPNSEKAHNDLGLALLENGKVDEAITQFQDALKIQPDYGEARGNLNLALRKKEK